MYSRKRTTDQVGLYSALAADYDRLHDRWLRYAGGEAQASLEAVIRTVATPHVSFLDVGCGPGRLARALIYEDIAFGEMTLLDPSPAMLARCADIPVRRVNGHVESLPFKDASFDIITCAWALETSPKPYIALDELCRVVSRGGLLCLAFCADRPALGLVHRMMRFALSCRGTGQFLSVGDVAQRIRSKGQFETRIVPCRGPVAMIVARRLS